MLPSSGYHLSSIAFILMYKFLSSYQQVYYELYFLVSICNIFYCNNMLHSPPGFPSWISCRIIGFFFHLTFLIFFPTACLQRNFTIPARTTYCSRLWAHHAFLYKRIAGSQCFYLCIRKRRFV